MFFFGDNPVTDIGTFDGGTVYGSGSNNSLDWQSIINQGFGIGSQIIGAWGRNPTQQVGYTPGVGAGYSPAAQTQAQAQLQAAIAQQNARNNPGGTGGGVGSTVGGGIDGVVQWATNNPLPVFLGLAAAFLLFRTPPGSKR